jgi:hypothetical protein
MECGAQDERAVHTAWEAMATVALLGAHPHLDDGVL